MEVWEYQLRIFGPWTGRDFSQKACEKCPFYNKNRLMVGDHLDGACLGINGIDDLYFLAKLWLAREINNLCPKKLPCELESMVFVYLKDASVERSGRFER